MVERAQEARGRSDVRTLYKITRKMSERFQGTC